MAILSINGPIITVAYLSHHNSPGGSGNLQFFIVCREPTRSKTLFDGECPSIYLEQNISTIKLNTNSSSLQWSPTIEYSWRIHHQQNWESQPRCVMWQFSPTPTTWPKLPDIAHLPHMIQRLEACHRLLFFITNIFITNHWIETCGNSVCLFP
jgi:hypothetical protein